MSNIWTRDDWQKQVDRLLYLLENPDAAPLDLPAPYGLFDDRDEDTRPA